MTPRSLFTIIIKTIGIYLFLGALNLIPQWGSFLFTSIEQIRHGNVESNIKETSFFLLFSFALFILILRYCFFKTGWIIDKLHLDRGFAEEKLEINIHRSTVLKIAAIVTGALIIVDYLPILCKEVFVYFQMSAPDQGFKENLSSKYIVFDLIKLFVGFFLITASRLIVNFIEKKRKGA